jgi:hypothetical protein
LGNREPAADETAKDGSEFKIHRRLIRERIEAVWTRDDLAYHGENIAEPSHFVGESEWSG